MSKRPDRPDATPPEEMDGPRRKTEGEGAVKSPDGTGGQAAGEPDFEDTEMPPVESPEQAKAILECLLFAATEPIPLRRIHAILRPMELETVQEAIAELERDYRSRGLQVKEVAGGFVLATRQEYADWVLRLRRQHKRRTLTKTMLETLAIVAYRQPVIKAEIDSIRGVDSGGTLRALVDLDLIDARDRRDVVGRPLQYRTTNAFLKTFGLKSLANLPSIRELREFNAMSKAQSRSAAAETAPEETVEANQIQSHVEAPAGGSGEASNEIGFQTFVESDAAAGHGAATPSARPCDRRLGAGPEGD